LGQAHRVAQAVALTLAGAIARNSCAKCRTAITATA